MENHNGQFFDGDSAIKRFLDPSRVSPLVKLEHGLNPYIKDGVRIFAKISNSNNIKFLPALNMLEEAQKLGQIKKGTVLVEASSGNMALGLALFMGRFGIERLVAFVGKDLAPLKRETLNLHNVEMIVHEGDGIARAKEMGKQEGFLNLNQYGNPANPAAYAQWLGPQIWHDMKGDISIFCAGLGTTGTMCGMVDYLGLETTIRSRPITTVGVIGETGIAVPGVRSLKGLEHITLDWQSRIDVRQFVGTKASYITSRCMFMNGIPAGPSSGFALRGLLDFIKAEKNDGNLDRHRNTKGEIRAVFICPDGPDRYLDKYGTHLDAEDFRITTIEE